MRKKITFLLALTAAVLLALPSQAQNNKLRNSAKPKIQKFESPRTKLVSKDAIMKAQDQTTGIAFRGKVANVLTQEAFLKAQAEKDAELKKLEALKWQNSPRFVSTSGLVNEGLVKTANPIQAATLAAQPRKAAKDVVPDPEKATVILTAGDIWGDGSGYQMLLDADATAYGTIFPETGALTSSGDVDASIYAEFEYKIPVNADGSLETENIVLNNSIAITIPEGTYDYCITNPTPGSKMWIAAGKNGRKDDIVFEKGHVYEFSVSSNSFTGNDKTTIIIDGEIPLVVPPYTADFTTTEANEDVVVLDANDDEKTWSYSSNGYAYNPYNSSNSADDYLILPIALEAGKNYDFTVNAAAQSASYPERFEVVYGTEPTAAAMTNTIIGSTDVTSNTYQDYTGSFSVATAGTYYVAIHAISDADMYYLKVQSFTIEEGAEVSGPAAVDNFAVTPFSDGNVGATITFDAPTKALDGTDLSAGDITKIEILRDGAVINTINNPAPGSAQSYEDTGISAGVYNYQAITYGATGIGGKSEILSVFLSGVLQVPYVQNMTEEGALDLFQVIDNNNDGKTWQWASNYGTYYGYSGSNAADDYLISMPIAMQAGKSYKVTVVAASSLSWAEKFEVLVGKEPTVAGLTITAIPESTIQDSEDTEFEGEFTITEAGNYHVAIHATSDADMFNLKIRSLAVEMGADPAAPAAIELTAEAGAEGAKEVNLSFTAPANAINGSALSGDLDVKIYRNDALVETMTGVAPGSAQTWKDTDVEAHETYTYYVVAANASGDGQKSNKVSVYVGPDDLADVTGFELTGETATTLTFAWDEVQGLNGGYIDLANIEYSVWSLDIVSSSYGSYLVAGDKLSSVTGETTTPVDYPVDEGEQQFAYFGVSASDGTVETDPTEAYTWALVGAPYDLPIVEGFTDGTNATLNFAADFEGSAMVFDDASDGDGCAVGLTTFDDPGTAAYISGKLNLKNTVNPTLLFDAKGMGGVTSAVILGSVDGGEWTSLGSYPVTAEYQTVSVPLANIKDATRFSRFTIAAQIANPSTYDYDWYSGYTYYYNDVLVIDNIAVRDLLDNDLSIAVDAPASVVAGKKATITATVTNQGQNPANGFTVTIKAGDDVLFDETVDMVLQSFETSEFTAEFAPDVFTTAGNVTITAEVTYDNDGNEANNTATTTIEVKESTAAQPTDVTATQTDEGVVVTWTAPDPSAVTTEVTEDFENGDLGEFTTIDNDGDGNDWTAYAYTGYPGHSGDYVAVSESYINYVGPLTPDNYLVTPLAVLNGTFSFWAWGQDPSYCAEVFGVYVAPSSSKTVPDVSAFQQVGSDFTATGEMTEYSVDLSSFGGVQGYIAIVHHNVTDMYRLNIDDVTYLVSGGDAPSGYNVYIDGELVTTVTDGTETTITGVEDGDHTVAVTAVYPDGSESKPVEVTLTTTGMGQIVINTNKPVDVYSLDGKLIRKQTVSLAGLKGAYIVNGHKVILK